MGASHSSARLSRKKFQRHGMSTLRYQIHRFGIAFKCKAFKNNVLTTRHVNSEVPNFGIAIKCKAFVIKS